MDFDDADGAAPKASRFVPKSKFQPKARPKPGATSSASAAASAEQPKPEPSNDGGTPVSVKKEQDSDQPINASEMEASVPNGLKSEISDGGEPMDVEPNTVTTGEEPPKPEEEDFVVREIDVYFNPSAFKDERTQVPDQQQKKGTQLFVFQYPLRPAWRPYELDESRNTEIRVNTVTKVVEIDLSVDVGSENYSPEAPSAQKFQKLTLSSKWAPSQRPAYAIGVFNGSELHLNPVNAVRQLRPSMDFLNPSASKKENVSDIATKATSSTAQSSGIPNKVMDQKDNEPWIPLKFRGSSSDLSAEYRKKMFADKKKSPLTFPMKPLDYLDSLCPQAAIDKMKPVAQLKRSLLLLPLDQRVQSLFTEDHPVHKFSALKHYAKDDPEVDVLRALEKCALLVQGNWVAKTTILYPTEEGLFRFARDFLLSLFGQSSTIKHSDLDGIKITKDGWKRALSVLATERPTCKDWKFIEPTDHTFIKHHPKMVEEYKRNFKETEEKLREKLRPKRNPMKADTSGKPNPSLVSDQVAVKPASGAVRRTMSNEAREALPKALIKLFHTHKVCSFQTICQGLRNMAVNISGPAKGDANVFKAAAFGLGAPQEELLEVISEVVVEIHGNYVLKSSEQKELNPLRNVVIDLFRGKGPNAKVKKSEIYEAAKMQLQKEPTNEEFRKVVSEICESNRSFWVLKKGDGAPDEISAKGKFANGN